MREVGSDEGMDCQCNGVFRFVLDRMGFISTTFRKVRSDGNSEI